MKCPDCKVDMERVYPSGWGSHPDTVSPMTDFGDPVWKCPKCRIEVEVEDE